MWYVIQTLTGQEKELVSTIKKLQGNKNNEICFVIQRECVWRKNSRLVPYTELLFPSYIFVQSKEPEALFFMLKKFPGFSRLLGDGDDFWPVHEKEQFLLEQLINGDPQYIIRRIPVEVDSEGKIKEAEGILGIYKDHIVKQRLRKRYVLIELEILGRIRRLQIGIRLKQDE